MYGTNNLHKSNWAVAALIFCGHMCLCVTKNQWQISDTITDPASPTPLAPDYFGGGNFTLENWEPLLLRLVKGEYIFNG